MRPVTGGLAVLVVLHALAFGLAWSADAGAGRCDVPHALFELELERLDVTSGDYDPSTAADLFEEPVELEIDTCGDAVLRGHVRGPIGLQSMP